MAAMGSAPLSATGLHKNSNLLGFFFIKVSSIFSLFVLVACLKMVANLLSL